MHYETQHKSEIVLCAMILYVVYTNLASMVPYFLVNHLHYILHPVIIVLDLQIELLIVHSL